MPRRHEPSAIGIAATNEGRKRQLRCVRVRTVAVFALFLFRVRPPK